MNVLWPEEKWTTWSSVYFTFFFFTIFMYNGQYDYSFICIDFKTETAYLCWWSRYMYFTQHWEASFTAVLTIIVIVNKVILNKVNWRSNKTFVAVASKQIPLNTWEMIGEKIKQFSQQKLELAWISSWIYRTSESEERWELGNQECSSSVKCFQDVFLKIISQRGFAWYSMYLRVHDFATSLGFLLYSVVWRKTKKTLSIYLKDLKFQLSVCVLIFLSLGCNLVM